MFLRKLLLAFLLVFGVVNFVRCLPLKTVPEKKGQINSQYEQKNLIDNRKQSFVNRKQYQYPKSNDIHYGKVVKQKITPIQDVSNVIYDGHHVVNLIAKAKATKDKHTIKEHALMLEKSAADKSGNLVDIDVFRRLLHLQAMRRDGINLNHLGQRMIDHTIDILNRMKLGSQYPKLAFEILDGQSLLNIMSAFQPTKQQLSPKKNPEIVATRKPNNTVNSKNLNTDKIKQKLNTINVPTDNEIPPAVITNNRQQSESVVSHPLSSSHSVDGGQNPKFDSPNKKTFQYPFDQSYNMIVDYPIDKPMKTGRNLLDADYTDTSIQRQGESGKQGVIDNQGSVNIGAQVNLPTTTSSPVTSQIVVEQKPLLNTPSQDRSSMLTKIQDQSQNDSVIQSSLPIEANNLDQLFETGNPGANVSDTNGTNINSDGIVLTSTPVNTSLENVALTENFTGIDPTIVGDTDLLLQGEIKQLIQNTTDLLNGKLTPQIEAPNGMETHTESPVTSTANRLQSLDGKLRDISNILDTTSESQGTSVATDQATKFQSSPTTQQNLTTTKATTTVDTNFDWCTFLCKVMKRCSPACSGHFTSWNR